MSRTITLAAALCAALLTPASEATAQSLLPGARSKAPASTQNAPVTDVRISGGILSGTLRDAAGQPVDGAVVVLGQRGVEIARTATDRNGRYTISDLQAGQYVIVCGNVGRVIRLWETAIAPPAARPDVSLKQPGAGITRGNPFGGMSMLTTSVALTGAAVGVGLGVSAKSDVDDLEHQNQQLRSELQDLRERVSETE